MRPGLFFDALRGRVRSTEGAERFLDEFAALLWFFALLTLGFAAFDVGRSTSTALRGLAGAPVYASLAWYVPRTKSRALCWFVLIQAILSLAELAGPGLPAMGVDLSKARVFALAIWNVLEVALAVAAIRVTTWWHRSLSTEISASSVALTGLLTVGLYYLGQVIGNRLVAFPLDLFSIEAAWRDVVATLIPAIGFICLLIPNLRVDPRDLGASPPEPPPAPQTPLSAPVAERLDARSPTPREAPKPPFPPARAPSQPRSPSRVTVREPSRRSASGTRAHHSFLRRNAWLLLPAGAAAVSAVLLGLALNRNEPPTRPSVELATIEVAAPSPEPFMHAASKPEATAVPALPNDAVFGGQTISWWSQRLAELYRAPGGRNSPAYLLGVERGRANGLVVSEGPSEVTVAASTELSARVRGALSEPLTAMSSSTATDRGDLSSIVAGLRQRSSNDTVFRRSERAPRIVLAPRPGREATIRIQFGSGSYHDGDTPGLTRLTQFVLLSASAHEIYQHFALDVYRAGGSLDISTGVSESAISLHAPAPLFDDLAARLIRLCLAPKIDADQFEAAKSGVLGRRDDEDLDELSTVLAAMAFNTPGFNNDPLGEADAVRMLALGDVRRHLKGPMASANATVVVAGAFDKDRMRRMLQPIEGGSRLVFPRPKEELAGTYRVKAGINLRFVAYPFTLRGAEDAAAAHLISALIEEYLFEEFRAAGVAYELAVVPRHLPWLDFVLIVVPFGNSERPKIGELVGEKVSELLNEKLSEEALERNKRHVLRNFASIDRTPALLAVAQGSADGNEWIGPGIADLVRQMTRERLVEIVRSSLSIAHAVQLDFAQGTDE
jgi:predicted Zn-dependent peptidase